MTQELIMQNQTTFQDSFSEEVWRTTYKNYKDESVNNTFRRVAKHIASAEITEDKHAVTQKENQLLLRSVETDLRLRIDRVRDVSENDSFTKDRRLRLLEERADILEKELAEQKRELNKLKQK